jgi:hypothetical protein
MEGPSRTRNIPNRAIPLPRRKPTTQAIAGIFPRGEMRRFRLAPTAGGPEKQQVAQTTAPPVWLPHPSLMNNHRIDGRVVGAATQAVNGNGLVVPGVLVVGASPRDLEAKRRAIKKTSAVYLLSTWTTGEITLQTLQAALLDAERYFGESSADAAAEKSPPPLWVWGLLLNGMVLDGELQPAVLEAMVTAIVPYCGTIGSISLQGAALHLSMSDRAKVRPCWRHPGRTDECLAPAYPEAYIEGPFEVFYRLWRHRDASCVMPKHGTCQIKASALPMLLRIELYEQLETYILERRTAKVAAAEAYDADDSRELMALLRDTAKAIREGVVRQTIVLKGLGELDHPKIPLPVELERLGCAPACLQKPSRPPGERIQHLLVYRPDQDHERRLRVSTLALGFRGTPEAVADAVSVDVSYLTKAKGYSNVTCVALDNTGFCPCLGDRLLCADRLGIGEADIAETPIGMARAALRVRGHVEFS